MFKKANQEIREAAKSAGVHLWRVADRLHIRDNNFSAELRKEVSPDRKALILKTISELKEEAEREGN